MRPIRFVSIHQSASDFGTATVIDGWHRARGWSGIGYSRVILNGHRQAGDAYDTRLDGIIQEGRPIERIPAAVAGHNRESLAICLIGDGPGLPLGKGYITERMWEALVRLCLQWHYEFGVRVENYVGHREFPGVAKSCPGFEVAELRSALRGALASCSDSILEVRR